MNNVLEEMIRIYQPNGVDWMGFKLSKGNKYTFHHIKEKRNGGKLEKRNGAILTKKAHEYLNYLERKHPGAYFKFQALFIEINYHDGPLTEELYEKIYNLLYQIQVEKKFGYVSEPEEKIENKKSHHKSKTLKKR